MKNLKFSLDVRNLFDGYRRVTLSDGSVPPGYGHDEIDPLGRTVQFSLRKSF
jgi:outer membrane receptor protein involved in Fe transport